MITDKKEDYNNYLACEEEINKLTNQKNNFEKELASITRLEQDKKSLLKNIENDRNEIEDFFSRSKDKLQDNGLSQEILAEISEFIQLEEANNDLINEISSKIEDLSKDIITKNENIVSFKQNIKAL